MLLIESKSGLGWFAERDDGDGKCITLAIHLTQDRLESLWYGLTGERLEETK